MTGVPRVIFVCTGNICRSPMAERIAQGRAVSELRFPVEFISRGTSSEEDGNPIDTRAKWQLSRSGYGTQGHSAARITRDEIEAADLVIAMEPHHVRSLQRMAPDATNIHLLSEFDPDASPGQGVPDPWYGGHDGFVATANSIESAMGGIFAQLRRMRATKGAAGR